MSKIPGESPGSSPFVEPAPVPAGDAVEPAYRRPGVALGVAAIGLGLTLILALTYPSVRSAFTGPLWAQRIADLVVLSTPLLVAVIVAGRLTADGMGTASGIRHWRWFDPVLGVLVGLVVRSTVELVDASEGSLFGPFDAEITPAGATAAVVLIAGLVLISPLVEELYFRGLVLRALDDALRGAGRAISAVVAVVVSTAAFTALHILPWGATAPLALLVGTIGLGLGCGILTIVTRRLGAAVVSHVTFNGIGVALLLA